MYFLFLSNNFLMVGGSFRLEENFSSGLEFLEELETSKIRKRKISLKVKKNRENGRCTAPEMKIRKLSQPSQVFDSDLQRAIKSSTQEYTTEREPYEIDQYVNMILNESERESQPQSTPTFPTSSVPKMTAYALSATNENRNVDKGDYVYSWELILLYLAHRSPLPYRKDKRLGVLGAISIQKLTPSMVCFPKFSSYELSSHQNFSKV